VVTIVKNKLEKLFSKSLKADNTIWGMKLHNNPLSHQNTPADYILSYENGDIPLKLTLVECKQVTCKNGKGRLAFKRLKQMHDLIAFENYTPSHNSYFCIAYYDKRWDKSEVYIIPVRIMKELIDNHNYVSLNREDALTKLKHFKINIEKGVLDLWAMK